MYIPIEDLAKELARNANIQTYNIENAQKIITQIKMLPTDYDPDVSVIDNETIYLCEYWQLKQFNPHTPMPPFICVIENNVSPNSLFFTNRVCIVVYGSRLLDTLLSLVNSVYDFGCKSSLITELSRSFLLCTSIEEMIEEGYRALKNPLVITNRDQRIIYYTNPDEVSSPIYRDMIKTEYMPVGHPIIETMTPSWNAIDLPFLTKGKQDLFPIICKPLILGRTTVGYFHLLQINHEFNEEDFNICELLGNLITPAIWDKDKLRPKSNEQIMERFLRDVLDNLLGDNESALAKMRSLGIHFKQYIYALVINLRENPFGHRILFSDLCIMIRNTLPGAHSFLYKNSVFTVLETDEEITDWSNFLASLTKQLKDYDLILGISNAAESILKLRSIGFQCREAIQLGEHMHPETNIHLYKDYAIFYMMGLCLKNDKLSALCSPELLRLFKHCKDDDATLIETLKVYLECSRSKTETAKKLFVHVNTVKYRISQIQDILQLNLSDDPTAFQLSLSMKMIEYAEKMQSYDNLEI
jgi:hypothetical protein